MNFCTRPPGCQAIISDRFSESQWPRAASVQSENAPCRRVSLNAPRLRGKCQFEVGYLQRSRSADLAGAESREWRTTPARPCVSSSESLCLFCRVKTSDLFERWRNLQVCRWEQNKEETSNFKYELHTNVRLVYKQSCFNGALVSFLFYVRL